MTAGRGSTTRSCLLWPPASGLTCKPWTMSQKSRLESFQDYLEELPDDERQGVVATATGQVFLYVQAVLQQADCRPATA